MIRIRKMFPLSFCLFLMALMTCVSGTFSYAENEEFSQEFDQWQTIVAGKWAPFEKVDLGSEWFTVYYPGPLLVISEDASFPDYVSSIRKAADRAADEKTEWIYCSHNYMEKGTDHLSRLADFLEGIQNGIITDCEWQSGYLCYTMDDEISIYLPPAK